MRRNDECHTCISGHWPQNVLVGFEGACGAAQTHYGKIFGNCGVHWYFTIAFLRLQARRRAARCAKPDEAARKFFKVIKGTFYRIRLK